MKINKYIISLLVVFGGFMSSIYGQKCSEFHKSSSCVTPETEEFKLSSLSRSHYLEVGKTITYEVVLYGQKEMIIQCCTEEKYYPLQFKLRSALNGDVIYDNKYDNYIRSIQLTLDQTELISIELTIDTKEESLQGTKACIGMAIYMEKTELRE